MNIPDIKIFYSCFAKYVITHLKSTTNVSILEHDKEYNHYIFTIYPNITIIIQKNNKFWLFNDLIYIEINNRFFETLSNNLKKFQIDTITHDEYNSKNLHFNKLSFFDKVTLKYYLNKKIKNKYIDRFKKELQGFFNNYIDDFKKIDSIDDFK